MLVVGGSHMCCGAQQATNWYLDNFRQNSDEDFDHLISKAESNNYLTTAILDDGQMVHFEKHLLRRGWIILARDVPNPVHAGLSKLTMWGFFYNKYGQLADFVPSYTGSKLPAYEPSKPTPPSPTPKTPPPQKSKYGS